MINTPITLCDYLNCDLHDLDSDISFTMKGRTQGVLGDDLKNADNNIAVRAAKLFFQEFGIQSGLKIHLNKYIPIGAGLGGGSSDAAAILRFLFNRCVDNTSANKQKVQGVALKIGADVPYFFIDQPSLVQGVGENVSPYVLTEFDQKSVFVLFPEAALETKHVFQEFAQLKKPSQCFAR